MRLGWHVHLLGPFGVGGTIWQSKRRRRRTPYWSGVHSALPGWKCPHHHQREDTAAGCGNREYARRMREAGRG